MLLFLIESSLKSKRLNIFPQNAGKGMLNIFLLGKVFQEAQIFLLPEMCASTAYK